MSAVKTWVPRSYIYNIVCCYNFKIEGIQEYHKSNNLPEEPGS